MIKDVETIPDKTKFFEKNMDAGSGLVKQELEESSICQALVEQ